MQMRRRFKQTVILEQRLADEARRLRKQAKLLSPGPAREALIRKARQAEAASHVSDWLSSSGLKSPI